MEDKEATRTYPSSLHLHPSDELVDITDLAGNIIGVVPRREMRGRRLPHRCTYILVFNSRGELFIHLRTPTKDVFASHWDVCVGGVLAAGEGFGAGARRELNEELGVDAPLQELFPFRYEDEQTIVHAVAYRAVHEGPFCLQPEEVVRGEFASVAEAKERAKREPFCPDGLCVLAEFERHCDPKEMMNRERRTENGESKTL